METNQLQELDRNQVELTDLEPMDDVKGGAANTYKGTTNVVQGTVLIASANMTSNVESRLGQEK